MDQTRQEFRLELEELVERVFNDLDELRAAPGSSQQYNLIDSVFRRVHSVKGLAAAAELQNTRETAHQFENLLAELRSGALEVDEDLLDLCDNAAETLSESFEANTPESDTSLRDQIESAIAGANRAEPEADRNIPETIQQKLTDDEQHRLNRALANGEALFEVLARFSLDGFDREFTLLKEKLSETGQIISTTPSVSEANPAEMQFTILYAASPDNSITNQLTGGCSFKELVAAAARHPVARIPALPSYIRTDIEKLDHLISSTHELLRTTTNALERALLVANTSEEELGQIRAQQNDVRDSFLRVEEELINLRMAELGPILKRAARAGRSAARSAGKRIHFELSGAGVPVDKVVAEVIADPLIHLVRNAVDHGIEDATERERRGKPARGRIRIEAVNEGSQSRVRVVDDGRGIDPQNVTTAAWALGLAERGSILDLEKTLRLIFRPGFTTASDVTELSGRGVGLDVVETAVEQVGGGLRVSSQPGKGSTFEIVLPVSFGLLDVTVVKSSGHRYCIPSQYAGEENGSSDLPVLSLRTLLGAPNADSNEGCEVICQTPGGRHVRILVDEVLDNEEVLVRNLGRYAGRWQGVAGAAELKDGNLALVLDLPRLIASI